MIRHIVLFKFKDETPAAELTAWQAELDGIRGRVPGLVRMSHGADIVGTERSFDYAVVTDFQSLEDLKLYDTHPLHMSLKKFSLPNSAAIHSVDFVTSDESVEPVIGTADEALNREEQS